MHVAVGINPQSPPSSRSVESCLLPNTIPAIVGSTRARWRADCYRIAHWTALRIDKVSSVGTLGTSFGERIANYNSRKSLLHQTLASTSVILSGASSLGHRLQSHRHYG